MGTTSVSETKWNLVKADVLEVGIILGPTICPIPCYTIAKWDLLWEQLGF